MDFLDVVNMYFRGERLESAFFIGPGGLFLLAIGVAAIKSETPAFAWSVAVPCFVFGLLLVGVGVGITVRTPDQLATLLQGLDAEPTVTLTAEIVRMQKVLTDFHRNLPIFGVIAAVGLALRFALPSDWAQGLGAILVLSGGMGLVIDGFASRRAESYLEALTAQRDSAGTSQAQPTEAG